MRSAPCAVAVVVGCLSICACLPDGNAPVGQHLIADRAISGLTIVPAQAGNPAWLIVQDAGHEFRTTDEQGFVSRNFSYDLYLVDDRAVLARPASGLSDGARRLIEGATVSLTCPGARFCQTISTDAAGRVLVRYRVPDGDGLEGLLLLDVKLGHRAELVRETQRGRLPDPVLSPKRARLAIPEYTPEGLRTRIHELDDSETVLATYYGAFIGEDYFFQGADDGTVWRLVPHGVPEVVARDVRNTSFVGTASHPLIHVCRGPTSQTTIEPCVSAAFIDPLTLTEHPIPQSLVALTPSDLSPDGRKAFFSKGDQSGESTQFAVLDIVTGSTQSLDVSSRISSAQWRPGHDEIWISTYTQQDEPPYLADGQVLVWTLGNPTVVEVPGFPAGLPNLGSFTTDGRFWFAGPVVFDGRGQEVRSADAPATPGHPFVPEGTTVGSGFELGDGRLLTEGYSRDFNRASISLVDMETGAMRTLADGGHILATSPTRALALVRWIAAANSGDLTLIDVVTGEQTLLAENVFSFALERGPVGNEIPPDPLASGARVAYLVRNRFASPYDGLWIATLP